MGVLFCFLIESGLILPKSAWAWFFDFDKEVEIFDRKCLLKEKMLERKINGGWKVLKISSKMKNWHALDKKVHQHWRSGLAILKSHYHDIKKHHLESKNRLGLDKSHPSLNLKNESTKRAKPPLLLTAPLT